MARLPVNVTFLDSDDFKAVVVTTGRLSKGSLGAIIGQFKSVCTKRIWAAGHDFAWQSRFHDEIIRDDSVLDRVREYIRNNTLQWELDKENPANGVNVSTQ